MMEPLVSIIIPNYNYGQYLRECFESILAQTYTNYEVIFRDNASTDDSFEIAMEYYHKFKKKGNYFLLHNNKYNYGSDTNTNLGIGDATGHYLYTLASDDAIEPDFLKKTISVLEKNRNVTMVMTNRVEVDENGKRKSVPPFYNKSCIIPGEEQAGVFMMSGIAIPGQRMCRNDGTTRKMDKFTRVHEVAGDWYNNFLYSCCGDIAYIKEDLCRYRVHSGNETHGSEDTLLASIEHFCLLNSFVNISKNFGMKLPEARYEEAVRKLGSMCLRYALKMICAKKEKIASRYLKLALVYDEALEKNEDYQIILNYLKGDTKAHDKLNLLFNQHIKRKTSYDPPKGAIEIDSYGNKK